MSGEAWVGLEQREQGRRGGLVTLCGRGEHNQATSACRAVYSDGHIGIGQQLG